jgi:hypothetical protein
MRASRRVKACERVLGCAATAVGSLKAMKHAWVVVLLVGCGDALPDLAPRGSLDCGDLSSCSLATGSELVADAFADTDVEEGATIDELEVSPPGVIAATIAPDHRSVDLHALVAGVAQIHAVLLFGDSRLRFDRNVRVEDVASTSIAPTVYPAALSASPDHLAAFAGSAIELAVTYHDSTGAPMLGHGFENWATTGGALVAAFADAPFADTTLFRTLQLADTSVVVTANDAQLAIDALPAYSTATLALGTDQVVADGGAIEVGANARFDVIAMTSENIPLLGPSPAGPPQIAVDDPTVVTFEVVGQRIQATTHMAGATTLHVSYDGAVATFQLRIM